MADRIVAFAGSLRRGSLNRALVHAAQGDLLVRFSRWIVRERAAAEAERELATKGPV